jgi:hypothetical protein
MTATRKPWLRLLAGAAARLPIVAALIGAPSSARLQTPAVDVAAQVRDQGYQCDEPISANRDVELSRPDSAVWVLKCANATYRVRFNPGAAAVIDRL